MSLTIILTYIYMHIHTAGGDDYEELNAEAFDVFLTFDDATRRLSFSVTIIDDSQLEAREDFELELRFDPFVQPPSGIILQPNVSTITILDNDSMIACV